MKDNFSEVAADYSKYRPSYPKELIRFILDHCKTKHTAWDCGTGNGQVAMELAHHFKKIIATDISRQQLDQAFKSENIEYRLESAEQCTIEDKSIDLITVAQAIHWFDFNVFYKQVHRVLKPGGIIAAWAYNNPVLEGNLNTIILEIYEDALGAYWDPERQYITDEYTTIPFPFDEIQCPPFSIAYQWTREHFTGYISTWSALKHYRAKNTTDLLPWIDEKLKAEWPDQTIKSIYFPCHLRMGTVKLIS